MKSHRDMTLVASHSYGWENGKQNNTPHASRYGIKDRQRKLWQIHTPKYTCM